ncbi:MAG: LacI family DNA-binding transcriptional regulator [Verrucomicrobiia bacterium]
MKTTLADLAKKTGLTPMGVSLALRGQTGQGGVSEKTRERVQKLAQRMGYQPNETARELRGLRRTWKPRPGRRSIVILSRGEFPRRMNEFVTGIQARGLTCVLMRPDSEIEARLKDVRAEAVIVYGSPVSLSVPVVAGRSSPAATLAEVWETLTK